MKISVIVPVYKVEKYLNRCIDSILNQTYQDFELILVDDGSPDNCGKICDEYAEKDNRIYVIHKENGGLSDARNAGLDWMFANSKSEWLTFVDSDDWIHPQYLKIMLDAVINNSALMSICNYVQANELSNFNMISDYDVSLKESEEAYIDDEIATMSAWAKLYHRTLWNDLRFPKGKLFEDAYVTHIPIFNAKQLSVVHLKLYYYFVNQNSITHQEWTVRKFEQYDGLDYRLDYLKTNSYLKAYICTLDYYFWRINDDLFKNKSIKTHIVFKIKIKLFKRLLLSWRIMDIDRKKHYSSLVFSKTYSLLKRL